MNSTPAYRQRRAIELLHGRAERRHPVRYRRRHPDLRAKRCQTDARNRSEIAPIACSSRSALAHHRSRSASFRRGRQRLQIDRGEVAPLDQPARRMRVAVADLRNDMDISHVAQSRGQRPNDRPKGTRPMFGLPPPAIASTRGRSAIAAETSTQVRGSGASRALRARTPSRRHRPAAGEDTGVGTGTRPGAPARASISAQ